MKHHKIRTLKKRKGSKTYRRKRHLKKRTYKTRTYKSKYFMRGGWGLNAAPVVDTFKKYTGLDNDEKDNDGYMGGWGQAIQQI